MIIKNTKNIPIRLDKRMLICYTKTVAEACVQALGTLEALQRQTCP